MSNGKRQVAMMALFTSNGNDFYGVLWEIEGDNVGGPTPFSALAAADKDENGRTTVRYSVLHPEVRTGDDLPLQMPVPDKAENGNTPYMNGGTRTNYPEGTILLMVPAIATMPEQAPAIVKAADLVTAVVDVVLTAVGATRTDLPYWFNDLFGSPVEYPVVCWASSLSGSCLR